MRILVDQDGVLANWELGVLTGWRAKFPKELFVPISERKNFYTRADYPEHLRGQLESIYHAPGFILNLEPIPGSISALKSLVESGHEVWICTSPLSAFENNVLEKYLWVEKHLSRDFTKRIIIAPDKTLVRGGVLIDDKPEITGVFQPVWEHIIFDAPYNRGVKNKKRIAGDWSNWREIINSITEA